MSSDVLTVTWDDLESETRVPVAPSWIETFVPMRRRVLPNGSGAGVDVVLPDVDSLQFADGQASDPADGSDGDPCQGGVVDVEESEDDSHSGAAAIAWAVAYRDGLEQGRNAGYDEGFASGVAQGRLEARNEGLARAELALAALAEPFERTLSALDEIAEKVACEATSLALGIAEAILDNELASSVDPGADAIARAARLLPDTASDGADQLTIRLNPDDVASLGDLESTKVAGRDAQVVADASVASGDCRMELGATRLDASVSAALARVRSVLSC